MMRGATGIEKRKKNDEIMQDRSRVFGARMEGLSLSDPFVSYVTLD